MTSSSLAVATMGSGAEEFIGRFSEADQAVTVVGVFESGFYVGHQEHLMAVVGPLVSSGPLHLKLSSRFAPPELGAPVAVDAGAIRVGQRHISLGGVRPFRPSIPPNVRNAALLAGLDVPIPPDLRPMWPAIRRHAAAGDVGVIALMICGRGRGLTPEGDDVLAGLLIMLASDGSVSPKPALVAASARTTDLSRAFLRWAAVGQSIEEVHDVLWAADTNVEQRFAAATDRLRRIGGSTGQAMLAGFMLASSTRRTGSSGSEPAMTR